MYKSILFILLTSCIFSQTPDTLWTINYDFKINCIKELGDHNILLLGDDRLLMCNSNGDSLWKTNFGGNWVEETTDTSIIIVGDSLVKLSLNGDIFWSKALSGTFISTCETGYLILNTDSNEVFCVNQQGDTTWTWKTTLDNVALSSLVYSKNSKNCILSGEFGMNGLIIWLNEYGDSINAKVFEGRTITSDVNFNGIQINQQNNGFSIIGDAGDYMIFTNVDTLGNIINENNSWNGSFSYGHYIYPTHDGYIVTGTEYEWAFDGDIWVTTIKTNSDGIMLWKLKEDYAATKSSTVGFTIPCLLDSGYFICHSDRYAVTKLGPDIGDIGIEVPEYFNAINIGDIVFENPVQNRLHIELPLGKFSGISLYNAQNELQSVFITNRNRATVAFDADVSALKNGIYFVIFESIGGNQMVKRVIIRN